MSLDHLSHGGSLDLVRLLSTRGNWAYNGGCWGQWVGFTKTKDHPSSAK